jgi:uncharacterized protein
MKTVIVFFSQPGAQWNPDKPNREQAHWDDHARFIDALFDSGRIMLGGPFADASGSMVVFAAESVDVVRAIMRDDPWAHHQILVERDIKEWTIFIDASGKPPG